MQFRVWKMFSAMALLALILCTPSVEAQERGFDLGFQLNILGGTGNPTNDILGYGVNMRYQLTERWWIRAGIDRSDEFDVEGPADFFPLPADFSAGVIDAKGTSTMAMVWIERVFKQGARVEWFWGLGAGINSVSFEPVSGPLIGGGSYQIVTNADDEFILSAIAGARWNVGTRWSIELIARGDEHQADWQLRDEVSGATAVVSDYTIRGATLGIRYQF